MGGHQAPEIQLESGPSHVEGSGAEQRRSLPTVTLVYFFPEKTLKFFLIKKKSFKNESNIKVKGNQKCIKHKAASNLCPTYTCTHP